MESSIIGLCVCIMCFINIVYSVSISKDIRAINRSIKWIDNLLLESRREASELRKQQIKEAKTTEGE